MNGLGGMNKSPNGIVIGLVPLKLPTVLIPADLHAQTARIVELTAKARRNMGTIDGPEVAAFKQACIDNRGDVKLYYRKMHPWLPVEA